MAADTEKMVEDWIAAWNSHDVDRVLDCHTDDCTVEHLALNVICHGKNELKGFLATMFTDYPDLKIEQEQKPVIGAGNIAAGQAVFSGTFAHSSIPALQATGKKFSVRGSWFAELHEGKVRVHTVYNDQLVVLQQLGLMPPMPPQ
jgi:steroid delta-isomerase-like uncharacterized protein